MKKITLSILFLTTLIGSQVFAQIPDASFSGFANNNAFNEWCHINHASVSFASDAQGTDVEWVESGESQSFNQCERNFSATFKPAAQANTWDVTFHNEFNLIFGKAVLKGNTLTVTAEYEGFNTGYSHFETTFTFSSDQKSLDYQRDIEPISGPSLFTTGTLYAQ